MKMDATDIDAAPVVSVHRYPQPYPQEWPCGCVTDAYITDRNALADERPFEMRLVSKCSRAHCEVRRTALDAVLAREDLLSSRDWPWTTDMILRAYVALQGER